MSRKDDLRIRAMENSTKQTNSHQSNTPPQLSPPQPPNTTIPSQPIHPPIKILSRSTPKTPQAPLSEFSTPSQTPKPKSSSASDPHKILKIDEEIYEPEIQIQNQIKRENDNDNNHHNQNETPISTPNSPSPTQNPNHLVPSPPTPNTNLQHPLSHRISQNARLYAPKIHKWLIQSDANHLFDPSNYDFAIRKKNDEEINREAVERMGGVLGALEELVGEVGEDVGGNEVVLVEDEEGLVKEGGLVGEWEVYLRRVEEGGGMGVNVVYGVGVEWEWNWEGEGLDEGRGVVLRNDVW